MDNDFKFELNDEIIESINVLSDKNSNSDNAFIESFVDEHFKKINFP